MSEDMTFDVVVVGGGVAGLSGAMALGRSRRSVLVIDAGEPRNAPAAGVHAFLTRDGLPPAELVRLGRAEVESYGGRVRSGTAVAANYGEARGAESRQDFIHKLRVVFKELNETTIWVEVIALSSMLPTEITAPIVAENRELCRVFAASIKTARASMD